MKSWPKVTSLKHSWLHLSASSVMQARFWLITKIYDILILVRSGPWQQILWGEVTSGVCRAVSSLLRGAHQALHVAGTFDYKGWLGGSWRTHRMQLQGRRCKRHIGSITWLGAGRRSTTWGWNAGFRVAALLTIKVVLEMNINNRFWTLWRLKAFFVVSIDFTSRGAKTSVKKNNTKIIICHFSFI